MATILSSSVLSISSPLEFALFDPSSLHIKAILSAPDSGSAFHLKDFLCSVSFSPASTFSALIIYRWRQGKKVKITLSDSRHQKAGNLMTKHFFFDRRNDDFTLPSHSIALHLKKHFITKAFRAEVDDGEAEKPIAYGGGQ
jgi:hypothetical protein